MKRWIWILVVWLLSGKVFSQKGEPLRGAWLTTVDNIDWPSRKGLSVKEQQTELLNIFDILNQRKFNAVFFQIRPSADAFYQSSYEPWSIYLTGEQGADPGWDPLAFAITEAHKRGLQLHAWINPYRAVQNINGAPVSPGHITNLHPEWFITYGRQKLFNPGLPEVWKHIVDVVCEIATKYDVDGIHMDDYFYPYRQPGKPFPDQSTFHKYQGNLTIDDWRRGNVDTVIHMLHDALHKIKPQIPFGISPFGVWRNRSADPRGSDTRAGQTNYDDLYADILKWLEQGWIDYAAPQLYWECGNRLCDYHTLAKWWKDHSYGKPIFAGLASYRVGEKTPSWSNASGILKQHSLARTYGLDGVIFYNTRSILKNKFSWADKLD
jgi:uncharacterized lipoprotein YddW (UPF0748 family)